MHGKSPKMHSVNHTRNSRSNGFTIVTVKHLMGSHYTTLLASKYNMGSCYITFLSQANISWVLLTEKFSPSKNTMSSLFSAFLPSKLSCTIRFTIQTLEFCEGLMQVCRDPFDQVLQFLTCGTKTKTKKGINIQMQQNTNKQLKNLQKMRYCQWL